MMQPECSPNIYTLCTMYNVHEQKQCVTPEKKCATYNVHLQVRRKLRPLSVACAFVGAMSIQPFGLQHSGKLFHTKGKQVTPPTGTCICNGCEKWKSNRRTVCPRFFSTDAKTSRFAAAIAFSGTFDRGPLGSGSFSFGQRYTCTCTCTCISKEPSSSCALAIEHVYTCTCTTYMYTCTFLYIHK